MASVTLNKIAKVYPNGFKAVHEIDFKINDGEFVVLVGPSGCAKSTLLRMVAGLESITAGELVIGDKVVNRLPPKERGAAMVFQNYALYPHMKVRDNLAFGLKLQGLPKPEVEARVNDAARLLEIEPLLDRYPRQLSGGQSQRVAVGRAIVKKPQVFLFDEPLSNLDAKLRASMRVRITELHQQLKTAGQPCTVIYVTHDQVEAMTMGERICVLKEGRIQQFDTPSMLYNEPANTFVAGFIGSPEMNMLDARLTVSDGQASAKLLGASTSFSWQGLSTLTDAAVTLGLRPENVLVNASDATGVMWLDSELSHIEYMGSEVFAYFKVGGTAITSRVPASQSGALASLKRGDRLRVGLEISHAHWFDAAGGFNLKRQH
ncbi:MAG: sn-glycerol-3-phosphate ABC transporter ATP-binding protein UgpC [Burkholderiales bacterium]|nr:MAG: sn-glycerol-3-phosphate ABC transporter ATP-binding protein UgpC [Burkholderiales bacterium]TAG77594.1 MAG: sn-glycerol-3-phosphate ABC transporter ATP-binding protein UgpC [Betaproteobacteria bacterium]